MSSTPLIQPAGGGNRWWGRFIDAEEAKRQLMFAVPMVLTNVSCYSITIISLMFAGHVGDLELAGATLASSWSTVTGIALMVRISPKRAYPSHRSDISGSSGKRGPTKLHNIVSWKKGLKELEVDVNDMGTLIGTHSYDYVNFIRVQAREWLPISIRWREISKEDQEEAFLSTLSLEYWAVEILVLLAGLMPNSKRSTSLIAICVSTEAMASMIANGLSAAVSTRVSNELGAGNTEKAKNVISVTLKLSVIFSLTVALLLVIAHNIWASFFSSNITIIQEFSGMTPLLAVSILFDSAQGILSGVSRGCGWQHLAAWTNLVAFHAIGTPLALLFGFKLGFHHKGLWIGFICGLSCQAIVLLVITLRIKWAKLQLTVNDKQDQVLRYNLPTSEKVRIEI